MRSYYSDTVCKFLETSENEILGQLIKEHKFADDFSQKQAWIEQIQILQKCLVGIQSATIYFEFSIPRLGKRADVILIYNGIIYILEFKNFQKNYANSALEQVIDYALDLKNFHSGSHDKKIIPILVSTEAQKTHCIPQFSKDNICCCLKANKENLAHIINETSIQFKDKDFDPLRWETSAYKPTPTIIEAAQSLYTNHSVAEIANSQADNLSETTIAIKEIIKDAKKNKKKSICFITGVPGSGKTLAGLDIAASSKFAEKDEHAVLLSGNQPLVDVLIAALTKDKNKKDKHKKENIEKNAAEREVKSFIQNILNFRKEYFKEKTAPSEKVVIFDEAQRAWNIKKLNKYMKDNHKIADYNMSEPDFLIEIMNRHKDWCVIICLVGGGQEINTGEAGISEWFKTLHLNFPQWEIHCAQDILGESYLSTPELAKLAQNPKIKINNYLHLRVSMRSFRSENLSDFVSALIDNNPIKANEHYNLIKDKYPIAITRDLKEAKEWIKNKARGSERYGMLASASARRLRAAGINVKAKIEHKQWFLENKSDIRSSYYLEEAATQFEIQGLELDWTLVCWDADLRYNQNKWDYYYVHGKGWSHHNKIENQHYLANAYRVLLTRARQGMVIFIPYGSLEDKTINPDFYDETYNYLLSCGIPTVKPAEEKQPVVH